MERGNVPAMEWMEILRRPWSHIRAILLDDSENSRRLRQNDPFCGILTPKERWEIYREARTSTVSGTLMHTTRDSRRDRSRPADSELDPVCRR